MKNNTFKQTEIGEIPEDWKLKQLQELADFSNGYAFSSRTYTERSDNTIPVFKMGNIDIGGGIKITGKEDYADQNLSRKLASYLTEKDDILMCMTDMKSSMNLLGHSARIHNEKFLVNQRVGRIRPNSSVDSAYLYYYLNSRSYIERLRTTARSGVQVNLTTEAIKKSLVKYPPITEQQQIASVLSSLDDKIELNRRMNKTLEEIGKALFKQWFVDFDFPNENGEPYKSSGGELVDSELGEIPKGWEISNIGSHMNIHDSQRIPLSSREREKRRGEFRYYGATGILDYVDDFLFDGIYLLLGEDGTVTTENGYPFTQYVWGKFWVNNHAHIIQGKDNITTEFLKLFFDSTLIGSYVTGAVQPKLNQGNLKSIPFIFPEKKILDSFQESLLPIFTHIRINSDEINHLSNLRDSLLPRLMSGKIRVN